MTARFVTDVVTRMADVAHIVGEAGAQLGAKLAMHTESNGTRGGTSATSNWTRHPTRWLRCGSAKPQLSGM